MMRVLLASLMLVFASTGCVTKAQARRMAQQAYRDGKQAAQAEQLSRCITIIGAVQNPKVPWVVGLTLSQAIATANYIGAEQPGEIIITRQGESATIAPQVLFHGTAVPLEPGDEIELH